MNGLSTMFTTILNMSITASYVAVGVMLIRLLLRRAPRAYSYALWSAVLIRLLTPVTFASAFSLLGFLRFGGGQEDPAHLVYVPQEIGLAERPAVSTGIGSLDTLVNDSLPGASIGGSVNPMHIWMAGASALWLLGVVGLLAHGIYAYVRVAAKVRFATRLRDNLYESDRIGAPFVFGLLKPKIYVPVGLGADELNYIAAHEETHIRRRDHLVKPLAYVAASIHWFNPLAWLSFRLMSKDMEMACDERVLNSLGSEESKAGYSRTLLSLATGDRGWLRGQPIGFGENHVTSRIKNILRYRRPAPYVVVVALALVIVLVVGFTANPRGAERGGDTVEAAGFGSDAPSGYDVHALYEKRTAYVGDNSKTAALIDLMPLPEGLIRDKIELHTSEQPYGATVHYRIADTGVVWNYDRGDPAGYEELFYRNGAVLMSLIGNAEYIDFVVDGENFNFHFDRRIAESQLGGDMAAYSENEELLANYIRRIVQIWGTASQRPPEASSADTGAVYVLAHSEVHTKQGETLYVNLEMTEGRHYTEAEAGGPGGGIFPDNYEGTYRLRVLDADGRELSSFPVSGGTLNFSGAFELAWADYNGDGQPDFTLGGQWIGSNGDVYALYTLDAQNRIEELKTDADLYIADHRPSILLDRLDGESFATKFYDPASGAGQRVFRWDGDMFRADRE